MLPIALRANGARAVIVGGGAVALRKAESLLAAGFPIFVVAPDIDPRLRALAENGGGAADRPYRREDLDGAALAVAATSDDVVNATVVADARNAGILVCDASEPSRGDFTMLATHRVGDVTFAVDSGGSTPAFSKRLIAELAERFGPSYAAAAKTLRHMRRYVRESLSPKQRAELLRALSQRPIEELAAMNPIDAEHAVDDAVAASATRDAEPTTHAVCATRASALAMTQTRLVAARLALAGIATSMLTVSTAGDRVQDRPLAEVGTNVFVKELELALADGRAQYAVHSCKDLPSALDDRFLIAAVTAREDARDAFCSERYERFEKLPEGAIVGTSSLRRRLQLQLLRPDLSYRDIRGNVDTRLRKLRDGEYDAIVLAMAGLKRLGARATYTVPFSPADVVPAVAQGALAIETLRINEALIDALRRALNDADAELCITAERSALRQLRAGCNAPVGIHATLHGGTMRASGIHVSENGVVREERSAPVATLSEAAAFGRELGAAMLARLGPLYGRVVVLPRTQERPSRIAAMLREAGASVFEVRDGDAGPPDLQPADALIFPSSGSVAAARAYLERLRAADVRPRVAAMGPESAASAGAAGFEPDVVAPEASVESLHATIVEALRR